MKYSDLKKSVNRHRGAFFAEEFLPRRTRKKAEGIILFLLLLSACGFIFIQSPIYDGYFEGAFFLLALIFVKSAMLEAFCTSHEFEDIGTSVAEIHQKHGEVADFETLSAVHRTDPSDIVRGFILSDCGELCLLRAGLSSGNISSYLFSSSRVPVSNAQFDAAAQPIDGFLAFPEYVRLIVSIDPGFRSMASAESVTLEHIVGAAGWVSQALQREKRRARWWSRENLARLPGIGKDWAYGRTYRLERYAQDISEGRGSSENEVAREECELIEKVLSRDREANVVLVGDDPLRRRSAVSALAALIRDGNALSALAHKRVMRFDASLFFSAIHESAAFSSEMIGLLNEAASAGNIILVIEDFAAFLESARAFGDPVSLIQPYLSSGTLALIAEIESGPFQSLVLSSPELMRSFEKVQIRSTPEAGVLAALEERALALESEHGILFTYPALVALARGAERYFSGTITLDKAYDLMYELPAHLKLSGETVIRPSHIDSLLHSMTGIPVGEAGTDEKKKLLDLENILHKRIVGQDEAVSAISNALRRARSGVENSSRPMGSFLFLGPTGVGKTETTKALAAAFFGAEQDILRLDMSEYRTADALERLIGSFERSKPGVLVSMLREHPFGVLLLDEFEKTSKDVLDLFLQILDEGMFSDMTGKKVSARNLIIIATSNAGSQAIFDIVKSGRSLSASRDAIIDAVVADGIFKPELLNRFDGTIFFQPLSDADLRKIAALMLKSLNKRLSEKGIELAVNDALLDALVAAGSDPKFGARPMNRAIQEKVEQVIAKKLLSGELKAGMRVELSARELR